MVSGVRYTQTHTPSRLHTLPLFHAPSFTPSNTNNSHSQHITLQYSPLTHFLNPPSQLPLTTPSQLLPGHIRCHGWQGPNRRSPPSHPPLPSNTPSPPPLPLSSHLLNQPSQHLLTPHYPPGHIRCHGWQGPNRRSPPPRPLPQLPHHGGEYTGASPLLCGEIWRS